VVYKENLKLKSNLRFKSVGFAAVFPLELNANYFFSRNINFELEISGQYALSDYLDGYTSQYSKHNDVYHYLNFVVIYKINNFMENILSRRY